MFPGLAKITFIFLGWFLLSVQNNKYSNKLTPIIGLFLEKFKNLPWTSLVYMPVVVLYLDIIQLAPIGAKLGWPPIYGSV